MDLNEIKNRLAKLNNKGGGGSSDFKNQQTSRKNNHKKFGLAKTASYTT